LENAYPVKVRFALGIGELDTPVNRKQALEMDGPAFHRARAVMDVLKKNRFLIGINKVPQQSTLIENLVDLLSDMISDLNRHRLITLRALYEDKPVKKIASEIGITDKAVYKGIQVDSLKIIVNLLREIEDLCRQGLRAES
jgi:hypothetical protein